MENSDKVNESSEKQEAKISKLELENSSLLYSLEQLQVELQEAREALHDQGIQLEKIKIEHENALYESNKICEQKEKLQNELMTKNYEMIRLETKNKNLEEQLDIKKKESIGFIETRNEVIEKVHELDKKLIEKESELSQAIKEKTVYEKKVDSLLDVLYGCPECGCNACECDSFVEEDKSEPEPSNMSPYHGPTETSSAPPLHPASSIGYPWTPPPTPPCNLCGGINFGPSPSEICFNCIPPLQTTTQSSRDSQSTTPPGTPPHYGKKN